MNFKHVQTLILIFSICLSVCLSVYICIFLCVRYLCVGEIRSRQVYWTRVVHYWKIAAHYWTIVVNYLGERGWKNWCTNTRCVQLQWLAKFSLRPWPSRWYATADRLSKSLGVQGLGNLCTEGALTHRSTFQGILQNLYIIDCTSQYCKEHIWSDLLAIEIEIIAIIVVCLVSIWQLYFYCRV